MMISLFLYFFLGQWVNEIQTNQYESDPGNTMIEFVYGQCAFISLGARCMRVATRVEETAAVTEPRNQRGPL